MSLRAKINPAVDVPTVRPFAPVVGELARLEAGRFGWQAAAVHAGPTLQDDEQGLRTDGSTRARRHRLARWTGRVETIDGTLGIAAAQPRRVRRTVRSPLAAAAKETA